MRSEFDDLPSGKRVSRDYNDDGQLVKEMHSHGMLLDIGCAMEFANGVKIAELYFVKKRMVGRERYEKARAAYPDMPPADQSRDDVGAKLLKLARREQQKHARAAKLHQPDPAASQKHDAFCEAMLQRGKTADASEWLQNTGNSLGEYGHKKSRTLVDKLLKLGCPHVYACEIETYEGKGEGSGHLVVELPTEFPAREKVFGVLGELANEHGFDADFDDGQRYAYAMLD